MAAPTYTVSDFAGALHRLMPRGHVWPRDLDTTQAKAMQGLGASFSRSAGRAVDLLTDAFPATTYELLPEWENTLGLPGSCGAVAGATIQDRQLAVVNALTDSGDQSAAYFIRIAARLGYSISIKTFGRYTVSSSVAEAITDASWAFTWEVTSAGYSISPFTVTSTVADSLSAWAEFPLGCLLQRIKPAHTTLIFNLS